MRKLYFSEEEKKAAKAEWDRQYREKNKDALKAKKQSYYAANKEKINNKRRQEYATSPSALKEKSIQWKRDNKAKHNANCMKRHAAKLKATPKWLTKEDHEEILSFYEVSLATQEVFGVKCHVDHIVPLQGADVCGLHVPWNLQVLPASVNCSKRNSNIEKYRV